MKNFELQIETKDFIELVNSRKIKVNNDFIKFIKDDLKISFIQDDLSIKVNNEIVINDLKNLISTCELKIQLI